MSDMRKTCIVVQQIQPNTAASQATQDFIGLKLNRISRIAVAGHAPDSAGMIAKVAHLVQALDLLIRTDDFVSKRFAPSITNQFYDANPPRRAVGAV